MSSSQSVISLGVQVSTPCGAVLTRGISVITRGLSKFERCGSIADRGMGHYPLRERRVLDDGPRGNSLRAGSMSPGQSATSQWGVGFPHRAGRYLPVGSPFSSPGCRIGRCIEGLVIRGWHPILSVCGVRYLYIRTPQLVNDRAGRGGIAHRAGRCRPVGSPFSSPDCWSCRCMEGFLIQR